MKGSRKIELSEQEILVLRNSIRAILALRSAVTKAGGASSLVSVNSVLAHVQYCDSSTLSRIEAVLEHEYQLIP